MNREGVVTVIRGEQLPNRLPRPGARKLMEEELPLESVKRC